MTSRNIIAQSGLIELFLQNFICLKTMLEILLKSGRLGSVCLYGEQGGESIHNEFNQLKITYFWMQLASRRLESMLQEHYRRIHPESKAVKFKNRFSRKRKTTL